MRLGIHFNVWPWETTKPWLPTPKTRPFWTSCSTVAATAAFWSRCLSIWMGRAWKHATWSASSGGPSYWAMWRQTRWCSATSSPWGPGCRPLEGSSWTGSSCRWNVITPVSSLVSIHLDLKAVTTIRRERCGPNITIFRFSGLDAGHIELWERVSQGRCDSSSYPKKRLSNLSGHIEGVKTVDLSPKW